MCRVESDLGPKEASIVVSVLHSPHSGPSYTPGEVATEPTGTALSGTEKDACDFSRGILSTSAACSRSQKSRVEGILPLASSFPRLSLYTVVLASTGVRLIWVQIWALPFINLEVVL